MTSLPTPVQTYVRTSLLASRSPAYLLLREDGGLAAWGGELYHYGITDLQLDVKGEHQVSVLLGLLPLEGKALQILGIEITPGLFVDLHVFPANGGAWVLLLDATVGVEQQHLLQQKVNEMALLQEDCKALFGRHLPRAVSDDPGHSVRDVIQMAAILGQLFQTMDMVVMERMPDGAFRLLSAIPVWLSCLCPEAASQRVGLRPDELFPYLEHFCTDAEAFWQAQRSGQLSSGPWRETDATGQEYDIQAFAFCLTQHQILCLALPKVALAETQEMAEKAREDHLTYIRWQTEIQKKDILFHSIIHDLLKPLTSIIGGLSFLANEAVTPNSRTLLDISLRQAQRRQGMIQEICEVVYCRDGSARSICP